MTDDDPGDAQAQRAVPRKPGFLVVRDVPDEAATREAAPPVAPARTLDDRQAAATLPVEEIDEREDFLVRLKPRHAHYIRERAAAHGEEPARHIETILRQWKAQDAWERERATGATRPA